MTICTLPDDILLEIFDFYLVPPTYNMFSHGGRYGNAEDAWHKLVHVCRRWRHTVLVSPHRLNLQLLCRKRTPVQNMLNVWPELPIVIRAATRTQGPQELKNIIAALEQHSRVCNIRLFGITNALAKKVRALKEPFPMLTSLELSSHNKTAPVLPDSFLGGSAPRLEELRLYGIPFPGLPKLLLSTTDLVDLRFDLIPHSGYISPEAMVTALSALTRLRILDLEFQSPRSRADRESRSPPPLTRVVLPALTEFYFKGDSEYLENIVSRFDGPLLDKITIRFFNQLVFDTPLLRHFISRTEFAVPHRVVISFHSDIVLKVFPQAVTADHIDHRWLKLEVSCEPPDWQLSFLAQICGSTPVFSLSTLERLEINGSRFSWPDYIENSQWLEFLHPFHSVKHLVLNGGPALLIAPAMQELTGERVTEVLPVLQNIFLPLSARSGPFQGAIALFRAARARFGSPVAVIYQD